MADTHGLSPEEVFCALYKYSVPLGMGVLSARRGGMTLTEAKERLALHSYVDYHRGRPIKVDFKEVQIYREIEDRLFDRDNGYGAAQMALDDYATTPESEREAKFHTVE